MNKNFIGFIGDGHVGCRGGSHSFREYIRDYWINYALPYYHSKNVTELIQLGDLFDVRKSISGLDVHWLRTGFIPALEGYGITLHLLHGNHCQTLLHSSEISWTTLLQNESRASGSNCVISYTEPKEVIFGDTKILLCPWLCKSNEKAILDLIESTDATVCAGHWELSGYVLSKGNLSDHDTINPTLLDKFEQVISGHYHTSSKKGNVLYAGSPYPLTWGEFEMPCENGLYLMETLSQKLEFIPNPEGMSIFKVLEYNHSDITSTKVGKKWLDKSYLEDTLHLKNKVVRIEVTDRSNSSHYKAFLNTLRLIDCVNFNVLDLTKEVETFEQDVTVEEFKLSTLEVLLDKVDLTEGINHDGVADKLKQVYSLCIDKSNLI
jgi:hypothetical protein